MDKGCNASPYPVQRFHGRLAESQKNHPTVIVPGIELADIAENIPKLRLRLGVHLIDSPQKIKVVNIGGAEVSLERSEDGIDRHVQCLGLLAIYIEIDLRHIISITGEETGQPRLLTGPGDYRTRCGV